MVLYQLWSHTKTKNKNDVRILLLDRARKTEYVKFDNPEFYDMYNRCIAEGEDRCIGTVEAVAEFISSVSTLTGIVAVVLTLDGWVILISVFLLLFNVFISLKKNKVNYNERTSRLPIERKNDYVKRLFYLKQFAKEIKVYSLENMMVKRQRKILTDLIGNIRKYRGKKSLFGLFDVIINMISTVGIMTYLGISVILGAITVGDFAALHSASSTFISTLAGFFDIIPKIQDNSLYINDFREFIDSSSIHESNGNITVPERFDRLEIQNMNYTYEGSEFALKNINLVISRGEKVAVVGENGSGKTTLIKMILDLYKPESGTVLYNGIEYNQFAAVELREKYGVVFQDIQSYDMTIAEYILLRDYTEKDRQLVEDAVIKSGLKDFVDRLPNGVTTRISTEFDNNGIELSGGQLQKLAIARIYANNYDFIILDEPTSALDPRSEYEFNKTLFDVATGKTVIFISHRLSTTRFADRIYFMENGRISEFGSHNELMRIEDGNYRELFNMQAESYRDTVA